MEELRALTPDDRAKLTRAMKRYQESGDDDPRPAVVDKYTVQKDTFIWRLKNVDREGQGRLLFYRWAETGIDHDGNLVDLLIDLVVYKKEGQDVPGRYLETARRRMVEHKKQKMP